MFFLTSWANSSFGKRLLPKVCTCITSCVWMPLLFHSECLIGLMCQIVSKLISKPILPFLPLHHPSCPMSKAVSWGLMVRSVHHKCQVFSLWSYTVFPLSNNGTVWKCTKTTEQIPIINCSISTSLNNFTIFVPFPTHYNGNLPNHFSYPLYFKVNIIFLTMVKLTFEKKL